MCEELTKKESKTQVEAKEKSVLPQKSTHCGILVKNIIDFKCQN